MKLIRVKDYNEMSFELNKIFVEIVKQKPNCVLSFTTGGTPLGMTKLFVKEVNEKNLNISEITMLNLDEYVGEINGKYSVHRWMNENVYSQLKSHPKNVFMFNAEATDKDKELKRYQEILNEYPRDVQMLGLGINGHIGANEPGTSFYSTLFIADSEETTIRSTMNLFNLTYEETPRQMFTMGFKEIMAAKCVVLAASGKSKAEAVKRILEESISENTPASLLKVHSHSIFIVDDEAASLLDEYWTYYEI